MELKVLISVLGYAYAAVSALLFPMYFYRLIVAIKNWFYARKSESSFWMINYEMEISKSLIRVLIFTPGFILAMYYVSIIIFE